MGSKRSKKPSLHSLSRLPINLPTYFKELEGESDRACALIAGAAISEGMGDLLKLFLVKLKEVDIDRLFHDQGTSLGDFAGRTDISFALGLISPQERLVANAIRGIRNLFAHTLAQIDFSHESIVAALSKVSARPSSNTPLPGKQTKLFFARESMRLYLTLRARSRYLTKQRSGLAGARPVPLYELCKETDEVPWLVEHVL